METTRPKEDWNNPQSLPRQDNKKVLAGVLGILLGSLGIHKFILGYNTEGIILLAISILGYATLCIFIGAFILWIPGLIGLIEGIIYLTKSDEEFYNTYQVNKRPWF
jgi:TM2 domain-containing membrane protein YozV